MKKVLFVCLGNICRSPMAQGVMEKALSAIPGPPAVHADSAATHAYHTGNPPDPRAITAAARRGIDISQQRARPVHAADFIEFDRIVVMDARNLEDLKPRCPEHCIEKLMLFSEFLADRKGTAVPDPYYGAEQGFGEVLDLLEQGMRGLLKELQVQ